MPTRSPLIVSYGCPTGQSESITGQKDDILCSVGAQIQRDFVIGEASPFSNRVKLSMSLHRWIQYYCTIPLRWGLCLLCIMCSPSPNEIEPYAYGTEVKWVCLRGIGGLVHTAKLVKIFCFGKYNYKWKLKRHSQHVTLERPWSYRRKNPEDVAHGPWLCPRPFPSHFSSLSTKINPHWLHSSARTFFASRP